MSCATIRFGAFGGGQLRRSSFNRQLIARLYATINPGSIQADNGAGLTKESSAWSTKAAAHPDDWVRCARGPGAQLAVWIIWKPPHRECEEGRHRSVRVSAKPLWLRWPSSHASPWSWSVLPARVEPSCIVELW